VNAAFLLVSSALLVAQPAAEKKPAPTPPPAAVSSCGNDCCDSGHRLFGGGRLRGLFSRDCCESCKPATTCHQTCREPLFHSRCQDACQPRWERPCRQTTCCEKPKCCAPAPTCNDCCKEGFLTRLRGRFQHGSSCCDSGCGTTTTAPPVKSGEKIDAPKKLPTDKKPAEEVRREGQPIPFAVPTTPAAPAVEVIPVPGSAPRLEGARRDPF
jgi:hypothetical protein